MHVTRWTDAAAFVRQAEPFLLAHEAQHCLPIGLFSALVQQPDHWPDPYMATVSAEDGTLVTVALRTPPHRVMLTRVAAAVPLAQALLPLVRDLRACYGQIPGVVGPTQICQTFAQLWQRETGQASAVLVTEGIYRLERVVPVDNVPGHARPATEADRPLLEGWIRAFRDAALPASEPALDAAEWVTRILTTPQRGLRLWEDGAPVTMVGFGGPTPHGIRIGPVYTPPELRRRGYASACVAATSQELLDGGRSFCFLFTDLANPTSNHIYQQVGYEHISDAVMLGFTAQT